MSIRLSVGSSVNSGAGSPLCAVALPVESRRDVRVEDEYVPREAPAGPERSSDALEDPAPVCPSREVEQRAERAVDERCRLLELEVAHVFFVELDVDAGRLSRSRACASIAGERSVPITCRPVSRATGIADSAVPDGELDDRALGLARQLDVERDVLRHVLTPSSS